MHDVTQHRKIALGMNAVTKKTRKSLASGIAVRGEGGAVGERRLVGEQECWHHGIN